MPADLATAFDALLTDITADLKQRGIEPTLQRQAPCSPDAITEFTRATQLTLPSQLSEFYTQISDGVQFYWECDDDLFGSFALPCLKELRQECLRFWASVHDFASDPHSMDRCTEPEYRPKAFEIWNEMRHWMPIWSEGNGDHFCMRMTDGHVVFDQHDWFDGFGEVAITNGLEAGDSLIDFIQNWSRFYFMPPNDYWWGGFAKHGRITWDPEFFNPDFVRAR